MHFDFLVCSERSGSNLITKMVNAHPDICGPFPSHVFLTFLRNYYRYGDLSIDRNWMCLVEDIASYMGEKFAVWKTTLDVEKLLELNLRRTLADAARAFYEAEARHFGKSRLFVKENHAYRIADYLLSHFPEARFLIFVRDPRDMAATWKELAQGGVITGATQWREDQEGAIHLHSKLRDIGRSMLVSFESLVGEAERTLRSVCDFLECAYDPAMLDYREADLLRENSNLLESWRDLQGPLNPEEIGKYRRLLSEPERRYVEMTCAREMEVLGYERDFDSAEAIEELEEMIAPASETDRTMTDQEIEVYTRWGAAIQRIESRRLYS